MPRPHLPHHISLRRVKSSSNTSTSANSSAPSTPPATLSPSSGYNMSHAPKSPGKPLEGDHMGMGLQLVVQVIKGRGLAAKDKSGSSDPFLVLTLGESKEATSVVSKSLNPEWKQTFEFAINSPDSALLEAVCWDKDRFKKDYMGEFDVVLEEIFAAGNVDPEPRWFKLEGRRNGRRKQKKDSNISGEVLLKFKLSDPINSASTPQQILQRFAGLVSDGEQDDDDDDDDEEILRRMNSSNLDDLDEEDDDEKEPSDETDDGTRTPLGSSEEKQRHRRRRKLRRLRRKKKTSAYEFGAASDVAGVLFLEVNRVTDLPPEKNMTKTTFDMDPFVVTSLGRKTYRTRVVRHDLNPVYDEKLVFQVQKSEQNYSLYFAVVDRDKFSGNDFVGTASFPLEKARELAPESDPETGLYRLPDPEAAAEGEHQKRKRFRNPLSRSSSRNDLPKLGSKNSSSTNLSKLAKSSSSSNLTAASQSDVSRPTLQHGSSELSLKDGARPTAQRMPSSGNLTSQDDQHALDLADEAGLNAFELPLELKNLQRWEGKHHPVLYIRAKYLPYRALRQQFWRVLLRQYDADESGKIDKIELVTMLDTLGSTLHNKTIDGFFKRWAHINGELYLTMDQAVICLEEQLMKDHDHHHRNSQTDPSTSTANLTTVTNSSSSSPGGGTPYMDASDPLNMHPNRTSVPALEVSDLGDSGEMGDYLDNGEEELGGDPDTREEHVVEISECPICHQPRISRGRKTTDADIITHIATCASSDWRAVNNLVMAGFVTSSQAQRKWYSKIITKVSYGGYKLGANSANILVQDRLTGQINEERMSIYVRLGIRLLYKGLKSREMEKKRVRKLLRSMSFKQGRKYDDPASASQITGFINFHQLDMNEVLLPTEQFKTFNEFFYRKLKPDARPCSAPNDPHVIVSPADCRSVVFNRLDDAQRIWVKGREFNVERLLGDAYPQDAKRYQNGALGIFRLAPQDYHRFHIPVDGVMDEPRLIDGEYYTVNPMAIRSALDVYGENIRVVVPIDSVCHGRVMVICVGAMMVGSTVITRKKGDNVKRAEELGYFKFGGSTILLLFEPGVMKFDEDLITNSSGALETLVRVGMAIGRTTGHAPHMPDQPKANPTEEEKQRAKQRIEGSLAPSSGHHVATAM
ncbi:Putative C2 domain, EF-hand domain, EF-hand domain pair, EF-Hand 1, calcium-binding protein [Septoria linicola]|uniref:Phosphatidylserine decarboxylase proenzyme 2 n=1 Tax=Septoria linicola TaxID=215465 RepID=A0A9Q9AI09_9PEZI|nr:Putative C2 domain, EF-hand domain, EF-hand domain pair, EF-Hand 1, calcium-binding protein [Septoria linicola]